MIRYVNFVGCCMPTNHNLLANTYYTVSTKKWPLKTNRPMLEWSTFNQCMRKEIVIICDSMQRQLWV
jgi:hypothetical protein